MGQIIGKYVGLAKKGTMVFPKEKHGYETPEGQVLKEEGQKFTFVYKPIDYAITYNLDGGDFKPEAEIKESYTIEDESYIPPIPVRHGYTFKAWKPEVLETGSYGDVEFKALWNVCAILKTGEELNEAINTLAGGKENVFAIQKSSSYTADIEASLDFINVSSTNNPIYFSYSEGVLYVHSKTPIYCNTDMRRTFEGCTLLKNIDYLYEWICEEGTDISLMFKDCKLLADTSAVELWANGNFGNFSEAFLNTAALEAGRVPAWYRWDVQVNYLSSTGKVLEEGKQSIIPDTKIYHKNFDGYKAITDYVVVDSPNIEYTFTYEPIKYEIRYSLNGGEINNPKAQYTIEDETYYPPEPVKPGFKFVGWDPECILQGSFGNVSFVANYDAE